MKYCNLIYANLNINMRFIVIIDWNIGEKWITEAHSLVCFLFLIRNRKIWQMTRIFQLFHQADNFGEKYRRSILKIISIFLRRIFIWLLVTYLKVLKSKQFISPFNLGWISCKFLIGNLLNYINRIFIFYWLKSQYFIRGTFSFTTWKILPGQLYRL